MIKDADEQPNEEIHRAKSGRVLSAGLIWRAPPSQRVHQQGSPLNAVFQGVLWKLHHISMIDYNSMSSLSLLPGEQRAGLNVSSFQPWLGLSGVQSPPFRNPSRVTSLE